MIVIPTSVVRVLGERVNIYKDQKGRFLATPQPATVIRVATYEEYIGCIPDLSIIDPRLMNKEEATRLRPYYYEVSTD